MTNEGHVAETVAVILNERHIRTSIRVEIGSSGALWKRVPDKRPERPFGLAR
jgi:hypothetical protein